MQGEIPGLLGFPGPPLRPAPLLFDALPEGDGLLSLLLGLLLVVLL